MDRHADKWTDKQTIKHTDHQRNKNRDIQTNKQTLKQTDYQRNKNRDRQTKTWAHKQTKIRTNKQTDKQQLRTYGRADRERTLLWPLQYTTKIYE